MSEYTDIYDVKDKDSLLTVSQLIDYLKTCSPDASIHVVGSLTNRPPIKNDNIEFESDENAVIIYGDLMAL